MKYLTLAATTLFATQAWAETPELVVYTYDSFVAEWGPGPVIEAAFEAECACDLKFVGMGDGAALLRALAGVPGDNRGAQFQRVLAWAPLSQAT